MIRKKLNTNSGIYIITDLFVKNIRFEAQLTSSKSVFCRIKWSTWLTTFQISVKDVSVDPTVICTSHYRDVSDRWRNSRMGMTGNTTEAWKSKTIKIHEWNPTSKPTGRLGAVTPLWLPPQTLSHKGHLGGHQVAYKGYYHMQTCTAVQCAVSDGKRLTKQWKETD